MKLFRRLSTSRLLILIAATVGVAAAASIGSMAAIGSSAQTPPAKPLDQALEDGLNAPTPEGVTARVRFTNNLFPSGALSGMPGSGGSALTSGGSGRLWWSPDAGGRIELQSDAGDAQILWDKNTLTIWDSSSNTVYHLPLPAHTTGAADSNDQPSQEQPPTLADIDSFLTQLAEQADVAGPTPESLAGEPAYGVTLTPAHSAGLIGSLELAWDATHGVPLELALHAEGKSTPALALTVTDISFGPVPASDLAVTPPADAKVVQLGGQSETTSGTGAGQKVTGFDEVQAAVPFTLVAPDTLVGLPRRSVQLLDGADPGALVLYGHGLGGIAVVEHAAGSSSQDQASNLPTVALGSATGHELATELGTVLFFDRGDVSFVLAGSMPPAAAEAAARSLG
jgi:outer membrane lipoprotein-sorting protein